MALYPPLGLICVSGPVDEASWTDGLAALGWLLAPLAVIGAVWLLLRLADCVGDAINALVEYHRGTRRCASPEGGAGAVRSGPDTPDWSDFVSFAKCGGSLLVPAAPIVACWWLYRLFDSIALSLVARLAEWLRPDGGAGPPPPTA